MAYKKNLTSAVSFLIIVSMSLGFVPAASATTISLPHPASVDLSAKSEVARNYLSSMSVVRPLGAGETELWSNGNAVVISSAPVKEESTKTASISEKIYASPSFSNGNYFSWGTRDDGADLSCAESFMVWSEWTQMTSLCGTPEDSLPLTPENTTLNENDGQYFITQSFTRNGYPVMLDYTRNTSVRYEGFSMVENRPMSSVNVETTGFSETLSTTFRRVGLIMADFPGDQTASYTAYFYCVGGDGEGYGEICNDGSIYKNGRTYIFSWVGNWTAHSEQGGRIVRACVRGDTEGGREPCDTVSNISISVAEKTKPSTESSSVARPFNSEIVYLSPTKCRLSFNDTLVKEVESVYCVTYGLSADGRIGTAEYHVSKSSPGFLVLAAVFVYQGIQLSRAIKFFFISADIFSGFQIFPLFEYLKNAVFLINAVDGLQTVISTISDPVVQAALSPSAFGAVETSNSLGVGVWTWSEPFNIECPAGQDGTPPNCVSANADICPNLAGIQTSLPSGYAINTSNGDCIAEISQTCSANPTTWTVNGYTCSNPQNVVGAISQGASVTVVDNLQPNIGSATFTCTTGGIWRMTADASCEASQTVSPNGETVVSITNQGVTNTYTDNGTPVGFNDGQNFVPYENNAATTDFNFLREVEDRAAILTAKSDLRIALHVPRVPIVQGTRQSFSWVTGPPPVPADLGVVLNLYRKSTGANLGPIPRTDLTTFFHNPIGQMIHTVPANLEPGLYVIGALLYRPKDAYDKATGLPNISNPEYVAATTSQDIIVLAPGAPVYADTVAENNFLINGPSVNNPSATDLLTVSPSVGGGVSDESLADATIISQCAQGTVWNGAQCVQSVVSVSSISALPNPCEGLLNRSLCSLTLSWVSDANNIKIRVGSNISEEYVTFNGATFVGEASGSITIGGPANGQRTYLLENYATNATLSEVTVSGQCVSGTTWNGIVCAPSVPSVAMPTANVGINDVTLAGSLMGNGAIGYFKYWTSDPGACVVKNSANENVSATGGYRIPASGGAPLVSSPSLLNPSFTFSATINNLNAGAYYYCAYASNSTGLAGAKGGMPFVMGFGVAAQIRPDIAVSPSLSITDSGVAQGTLVAFSTPNAFAYRWMYSSEDVSDACPSNETLLSNSQSFSTALAPGTFPIYLKTQQNGVWSPCSKVRLKVNNGNLSNRGYAFWAMPNGATPGVIWYGTVAPRTAPSNLNVSHQDAVNQCYTDVINLRTDGANPSYAGYKCFWNTQGDLGSGTSGDFLIFTSDS